MTRLLFAAVVLALGLVTPALSAEPAPAPAPAPAKPKFVLVLGEKAADPEKFAAEFLAERLRRDLGAEAAIGAAAPAAGEAQAVILGTPESNPALAKFKKDLDKAEFLITTDGGATVLVGESPRAVVYAVSRLLQERGWRFYALHDLGEVPIDPKTAMPAGPIKDGSPNPTRALGTDSLGDVLPRYLDWMALNGLNRLVVRIDKVSLDAVAAAAKEVARRGLDLELTAPGAWWAKQGADPEKKVAAKVPGVKVTSVCDKEGERRPDLREPQWTSQDLVGPFSGPSAILASIHTWFAEAHHSNTVLTCPPRHFFLDEDSLTACYYAASAWKGWKGPHIPVEDFVKDYCARYYGRGASGEEIAEYFLGLEKMSAALLDEATFAKWKGLADKFRAARVKAKANTPPRKRIALYHIAVLDHLQTCAEAARLLKKAEVAEAAEKRKLLLEAIKLCWDYNRRKEPRVFDYNPGDAFAFRDASGKSPELEGELVLLEKARALLLAGEDGKLPAGLVAAALAEGGGGKVAVTNLAAEVGGNKAESFADGKRETAAVLAPLPPGRFTADLGKEVSVSRVRFLSAPDRPVTQFRLRAVDAGGAATTLAEGALEAPEMFLVREVAFPAVKARALVLEVERYQPARQDPFGPALAEFEAYEK